MPRPPREDHVGAWWHLTNRVIAKRPVFETREDVERFYAAIDSTVDAGLIEVHAFTVLTTHYHRLARSPDGEISQAMKLITNRFVRWFNRTRRRDGALFRGRFCGRRIDDPEYWEAVLRYVDLNPVRAGLCRVPSDHPFGSARAYRHGEAPEWLSRDAVERTLLGFFDPDPVLPENYDRYACGCDAAANAFLVERLLRRPDVPPPPMRDLVRAATLRQQGWMEWKAALADGVPVGTAFLTPPAALRAARAIERCLARRPLPATRGDFGRDLAAGLLRTAVGLDVSEIAHQLGVARSTVHASLRRHELWLAASSRYADLVARALRSAVRRTLPSPGHLLELPRRVGSGEVRQVRAGVPLG